MTIKAELLTNDFFLAMGKYFVPAPVDPSGVASMVGDDQNGLRVDQESIKSADPAQARAAQQARSKKYGIGIKNGGNVTKPSALAAIPDEEWGDPVNYRYHLEDAAHVRDALSRWGDANNRKQYTASEQRIILGTIQRRAKALGIGES